MNHKNTENNFIEPSNQLCTLNNVVINTYDLRDENTVFLSDFTLLSPLHETPYCPVVGTVFLLKH